jgi:hypothetical protein
MPSFIGNSTPIKLKRNAGNLIPFYVLLILYYTFSYFLYLLIVIFGAPYTPQTNKITTKHAIHIFLWKFEKNRKREKAKKWKQTVNK